MALSDMLDRLENMGGIFPATKQDIVAALSGEVDNDVLQKIRDAKQEMFHSVDEVKNVIGIK